MSIDGKSFMLEKGEGALYRGLRLWVESSRRFSEALDFYSTLVSGTSGGAAVLEFVEGVVARRIRSSGVSVTSVPWEKPDNERENAPGSQGFWGDQAGDGRFGLMVAPLGVLELLWCPRMLKEGFKGVADRLEEGGMFVFDARIWREVDRALLDGAPRLVSEEMSDDGRTSMLWETWRPSGGNSRVVELTLGVESVGGDGVVERKFYLNLLLGEPTPEEVASAADNAGLNIEGMYGDFNSGGFSVDSDSRLWILSKPLAEGRP